MQVLNYSGVLEFATFDDRLAYLCVIDSLHTNRHFKQLLYSSPEWKHVRRQVVIRDQSCDLGILDRPIRQYAFVHHIDPITDMDVINRSDKLFDLDNLITVSRQTHEAIHRNDPSLVMISSTTRKPGDTTLW